MSSAKLTASKLHIARHCLHPWDATATHVEHDAGDSFARRRGTLAHTFIDEALSGLVATGVQDDDPAAVEARVLADNALAWWRAVGGGTTLIGTEQAFGIYPDGRVLVLGRVADRAYQDDAAVWGTADLVWVDGNGRVNVLDWKTGRPENVEPVHENAQLAALAAMAVVGVASQDVDREAGATVWLAFVSEGGVDARSAHIPPHHLHLDRKELASLADVLQAPRSYPAVPGDHCRYCPRRTCEARDGIARDLVPVDGAPSPWSLDGGIDSPERAAWLVERLALAEKVLDNAKVALRSYADEHGGIALADGSVWARREETRETIASAPQVDDLLREFGLGAAVETSSSKSAIEKAAKALGDPEAAKIALAELRDRGLIKTTTINKYAARKPRGA